MDQFGVYKTDPTSKKKLKIDEVIPQDLFQGGKSSIFAEDEVNPLIGGEDDLSIFESYQKRKGATPTSKRYKKRNKDEKKPRKYYARNPQPNYSNFKKPQYVDMKGREYKLASGEIVEQYTSAGDISHPEFEQPPLRDSFSWGTQIFWIRIPIDSRDNVHFPQPQEGRITLYHIRSQVLCTGITDGVYYGPKKKTGFVVLRKFTSYGQVPDPSPYSHLVDEEKKIKWKRALF